MEIKIAVESVDLTSVIGEWREYDVEGDYVGTGEKTLGDAVAAQIAADLKRDEGYSTLRRRVMELRDQEIRTQIAPIVAKAIEDPVQRTNEYGRPVGEPTTLTELIVKEVHAYLTRRSDQYRSGSQTVVEKFVADAVDKVVKRELAEVIVEEKAKVVAAVRAKAAELIAQAVKEGVGR